MQQPAGKSEQSPPLVLVIDPQANIIEFISLGLRYEGYQVEGRTSGLEGLEMARRIKPELIILELALPDIDGIELCRQLRTDEATHELPIIVLTSLEDARAQIQAQDVEVSAFMTKPFDFYELLEKVKSLVPPPRPNVLLPNYVWGYDYPGEGLPPNWRPPRKRQFDD